MSERFLPIVIKNVRSSRNKSIAILSTITVCEGVVRWRNGVLEQLFSTVTFGAKTTATKEWRPVPTVEESSP